MLLNNINKTSNSKFVDMLLHIILILFSMFCLIPLLLVVSISLTDEAVLIEKGYRLIPEKFSSMAYVFIYKNPLQLLNSYAVTIAVCIIGSVAGIIIVSMLAYTTIRKDYKYRNVTSFIVFFTTLFNGGLIPWYILIVNYLHLKNTLIVLFLPYLVNVWYVFLMRGFLISIPPSLIESAKIDGASELRIFFRIIMPLSKPGLATVGLFYALTFWNDWWLPLLFIEDNRLVSLQFLLYKIMSNLEFVSRMQVKNSAQNIGIDVTKLPQLSARMAMCVIAAGPMLFAFPFFQKYFIRGLTIGSLKG